MAANIILNFKWSETFLGSRAYIELGNFTKASEGDFPQLSPACVTPKEIEDEAEKLKKQLDEVGYASFCRCAYREMWAPNMGGNIIGFRCVRGY